MQITQYYGRIHMDNDDGYEMDEKRIDEWLRTPYDENIDIDLWTCTLLDGLGDDHIWESWSLDDFTILDEDEDIE